ncbi:MAG: tetratricopeptide repeat protein [Candidatus Acidiferrum sp.]
MKCSVVVIMIGAALFSPAVLVGQLAPGLQTNGTYAGGVRVGTENLYVSASVEVQVNGPGGAPVDGSVAVSLIRDNGQVFITSMAQRGRVRFAEVPKSELTAQVIAPGYQTAKKSFEVLEHGEVIVKIELQPMTDKEAAASDKGIAALSPKAQKDVGKALEALRVNRPVEARSHLEAAQRDAPNSAEVEYLFGVSASQMNNEAQARSYWTKALELNPNHLSALLAMGQDLLHDHKAEQAAPYLDRAVEVEPSSWRAHMLIAQADLFEGKHDEAAKEAERALELGHDRAASVQPLLAHALFENGEKDRAIKVLKEYIAAHPTDANAPKLLGRLTATPVTKIMTVKTTAASGTAGGEETADMATDVSAFTIVPNWLPPDIDEKIPSVEAGATCSLDDVVQKAGAQLVAFVHDVDRFTATENLMHESINKYGTVSAPQKRKFDYLVSIQEVRKGYLGVTEYRNGGGAQNDFPGGVVTNGLPALVLIFHPYYAPNYEMTCEGLSRANGGLAWQVHFRQKLGKPNELKTYQIGMHGPSYSVGLKGRAWISADNYQIVRMETDIVAPLTEIKLLAEHTAVEYGPVNFRTDNVSLWLPQSAEVYFAWRGRQVHRRHSFNNYMLFAVDDKQRIATPKDAETTDDASPGAAQKP